MKRYAIALCLLACSLIAHAQSAFHPAYQPHVVLAGNSWSAFEQNLQTDILPQVLPSNVFIGGHPGNTCGMIKLWIKTDVFGTVITPRNPDVAVLVNDTTNDLDVGTTPADLLTCLQGSIDILLGVKPTLKIVVLTTPPQTIDCNGCLPCYADQERAQITAFNEVIPSLQQSYPHNVRVLDANTPFLLNDGSGYADPTIMAGACGRHPGDAEVWDGGQPNLAAIYRSTVMNSYLPW